MNITEEQRERLYKRPDYTSHEGESYYKNDVYGMREDGVLFAEYAQIKDPNKLIWLGLDNKICEPQI